MTTEKIGYIRNKQIDTIFTQIHNSGYENKMHIKYDSDNNKELWVEIEEKEVLELLIKKGYISEIEKNEILDNDVETLLFF